MLAQAASLLNKKGSTIIPSAQNAASMHMQRKNVFRGDANLYDDMSSVAIQTPYLSSLADISKSLHKTGSAEARKPQPLIAPRPSKPTSTEKPKEGNLKTDAKPEVIKEPPKKAEEPAKEPSEKPVTSDKAGSPDKSAEKGEMSPATPDEDLAFQAVVQQAKSVAERQEIHPKAKTKANEAEIASKVPKRQKFVDVASAQVEDMHGEAEKPPSFDKDAFVAALKERVGDIKVNSADDVSNLKDQIAPVKGHMSSEVTEKKQQAEMPIKNATAPEAADEANKIQGEPKELTALVPGSAPLKIRAEMAAPKPKAESELSFDEDSKKLDELMTQSDITEEQLQRSNEPSFQEAVVAKNGSQAMAREAPALYSQDEEAILDDSRNQALTSAGTSLNSMYKARTNKFKEASGTQKDTKDKYATERKRVADGIEGIYDDTKGKVNARLAQLETDITRFYDWNANDGQKDFEKDVYPIVDRYSGASGAILAIDDWARGPPDWVEKEFEQGRKDYFKRMEAIIIGVARMVETGLKEVNTIIDKGWKAIEKFKDDLKPEEVRFADEAIENIGDKFDTLRQSVGDKFNDLVDLMAQKYRASRKKIDDRLDEIRASMRPVWEKAYAFLKEVAKTIIGLGKLLLQVLVKGVAIVGKIIKDPIGFLGNLIKGVKAGLDNFIGKLPEYLEEGLKDWLFEELGQAGIQKPQSLDFKGILSIVLQVLGLTYGAIREIAVTKFGEEVVKRLEQTSEIFQILISEGPGGLWKYILEKLGDLKEMIIDGIKSFVKTKVIEAGIKWILSLLTPASAFIKAAKAIYDIVKFIITRASQIASFVNAVLDSLGAIAEGNITSAASAVENALAKGVPVVIGFLASILGLDDIGESVRGIILKARARVHKGVEWVLDKAVSMVKSAGGFVKDLFKGKKVEEAEPSNDPQHNARITEGILAIKAEEEKYDTNGKLLYKDAEKIAVKVKARFPVFKSINVVDGGDNWVYHYVGSSGDVEGKSKAPDPLDAMEEKLSWEGGEKKPKNIGEARSVRQAIAEGKINTKGLKVDRPDMVGHDFVLRNKEGKEVHYIELKSPINPRLRKVETQAEDIGEKIKKYGKIGKGTITDVIVDLKYLNPADQLVFLNGLKKEGVDLNEIVLLNEGRSHEKIPEQDSTDMPEFDKVEKLHSKKEYKQLLKKYHYLWKKVRTDLAYAKFAKDKNEESKRHKVMDGLIAFRLEVIGEILSRTIEKVANTMNLTGRLEPKTKYLYQWTDGSTSLIKADAGKGSTAHTSDLDFNVSIPHNAKEEPRLVKRFNSLFTAEWEQHESGPTFDTNVYSSGFTSKEAGHLQEKPDRDPIKHLGEGSLQQIAVKKAIDRSQLALGFLSIRKYFGESLEGWMIFCKEAFSTLKGRLSEAGVDEAHKTKAANELKEIFIQTGRLYHETEREVKTELETAAGRVIGEHDVAATERKLYEAQLEKIRNLLGDRETLLRKFEVVEKQIEENKGLPSLLNSLDQLRNKLAENLVRFEKEQGKALVYAKEAYYTAGAAIQVLKGLQELNDTQKVTSILMNAGYKISHFREKLHETGDQGRALLETAKYGERIREVLIVKNNPQIPANLVKEISLLDDEIETKRIKGGRKRTPAQKATIVGEQFGRTMNQGTLDMSYLKIAIESIAAYFTATFKNK